MCTFSFPFGLTLCRPDDCPVAWLLELSAVVGENVAIDFGGVAKTFVYFVIARLSHFKKRKHRSVNMILPMCQGNSVNC